MERKTEKDDPTVVRCEHCQRRIGTEVALHGKTYLDIGVAAVYRLHGYCVCGYQVHWDATEVIYRRMMRRIDKGND